MWKIIKKTTKRVAPKVDYKPIYTVLFAVAMAMNLTARDVLKEINSTKASKFAKDITAGLRKKMAQDREKAQKELKDM